MNNDESYITTVGVAHNCRCVLLQEGPDIKLTPTGEKDDIVGGVMEEMQDVFKQNPGKTGEVFDKEHPYFEVPEKDKAFAKRNFDMPIPPTDEPGKIIPLAPEITEIEEEAVKKYSESWAYPKIQKFLRSGIEDEHIDYIKDVVKEMDSFLKKSDKFEGETYRGLQFDKKDPGLKELIKAIKAKGELIDNGFMSTTADESVVSTFMDNPSKTSMKFIIEGKSGVDISHIARDEGEKEVLFPRGTKFKVVDYEEKDYGTGFKHYNVKLKEL